jgi:hypothetical protein
MDTLLPVFAGVVQLAFGFFGAWLSMRPPEVVNVNETVGFIN